MELVKIAEYDDEKQRLTYEQAVKAAKAKGCRLLTAEEWMDSGIKSGHKLYCCAPTWIQKTKEGLSGSRLLLVVRLRQARRGCVLHRRRPSWGGRSKDKQKKAQTRMEM